MTDIVPLAEASWGYVVVLVPPFSAAVIILDFGIPVSSLRWMARISVDEDDDAGVIGMVRTDEEYRRQGHATRAFRIAESEARARGWTAPRHDPQSRTPDGQKWSTALGADPAELTAMPSRVVQRLFGDQDVTRGPGTRS